jgi:hypothetical protein
LLTVVERRAPNEPLSKKSLAPTLDPTYSHHSTTVEPLALQTKITLEPDSAEPGTGLVIVWPSAQGMRHPRHMKSASVAITVRRRDAPPVPIIDAWVFSLPEGKTSDLHLVRKTEAVFMDFPPL